MRRAWEAVFLNPSCSWRSVAGPFSAPRMSLTRLGCCAGNFTMVRDDRGFVIPLRMFPRIEHGVG
eukprot:6260184-Pyramimonas_sp.AAC.1